jgi:hypothetical protein
MPYDPLYHMSVAMDKLFGYGILRPERPAPDPFEVENRWIVAADGRTYREYATGSLE